MPTAANALPASSAQAHVHAAPSASRSRIEYGPAVYFEGGDARYLLYSTYTKRTSHPHGTLYVRTKAGATRSLGPLDSPSRDGLSYSLMGSNLTASEASSHDPKIDSKRVLWWNLAAHTFGHVELPSRFDTWAGSTPAGFLFYRYGEGSTSTSKNGYSVESIPSGHVTKLAAPVTDDILAGPTGYVEDDRATNTVAFQSYAGGRLVTLAVPHKYHHDKVYCTDVWVDYVRCFVDGGSDGEYGYHSTLMLPLDGKKSIDVFTHHGPVPLRHVLVWSAGHAHLRFRTSSGTSTATDRGRIEGEAFEEVILSNHGYSKLRALRSANATPTVVAHL